MITQFKAYLAKTNLAENTITSYVWTVTYYLQHYKEVNKKNLLAYKGDLVENFKPQTVNLRLQAVNKFLEFSKQEELKMKFVKAQQKNFLENVISDADYKFLKTKLKADGYDQWYFIVWLIAMSGATTGKMGVYKYKTDALLNQRVGNLKCTEAWLQQYRNYFMLAKSNYILNIAYGGAQPNISAKAILSIKIDLPPINEQHRIVAKIEELFTQLDNITSSI